MPEASRDRSSWTLGLEHAPATETCFGNVDNRSRAYRDTRICTIRCWPHGRHRASECNSHRPLHSTDRCMARGSMAGVDCRCGLDHWSCPYHAKRVLRGDKNVDVGRGCCSVCNSVGIVWLARLPRFTSIFPCAPKGLTNRTSQPRCARRLSFSVSE